MGRVDVIGLGPAGVDLLTTAATGLIATVGHQYLRTARHPAAEAMPAAVTFDHLYEELDTFEEVYEAIVDSLVAAGVEHGRVLYAVPGSPVVAERTVELLVARARTGRADSRPRSGARSAAAPDSGAGLDVVVHPALSFLDLAWARLGVDPVAVGVHLVDGHRFEECAPTGGGAVLVAQCESRFTLSDIKLAVEPPPEGPVVLLARLGLPDERIVELDWADIDRAVEPDHLTSLWIPELPPAAGGRLQGFAALMERLRTDDPWKAEQTHDSLKRYLLEEAHEVLEAIDAYDPGTGEGADELASELGDMLYQVVFHASLAAEAGWFELADVVAAIHDKLEARHPHLDAGTSGAGGPPTVEELVADWERAKVAEHGRESAFDGIPAELPALLRALKVLRKAEALGLELPVAGEGIGARLFAEVQTAAATGVDPEDALRRHVRSLEFELRNRE